MKKYSLKKGIWKGLGAIVSVMIILAGVSAFSDVQLTVLIETHLFPLIGGLTGIGALRLLHNLIKFKISAE